MLFRTWDRNVGASLGLGLSDSSYRLFQKLRWPDVGPVPCLVKPLTRRRAAAAQLAGADQPARLGADAADHQDRRARAAAARGGAPDPAFDESFTTLWDELAPKFDLAVRRDAAYLNWKYVSAPHVRYCDRRAAPRRSQRRLRRLPARARAARPRHAARGLPRRSRRRRRAAHAAALGRSRGAAGRLRQDPRLRDARRLPARAAAVGLLPGEIDDGVRGEGQRGRRAEPGSTRAPTPGTSRSATPTRIDERGRARLCSSASTPKATTSGTPRRARTSRSRTSTPCRACTRSSRGTACGRRT